MYNTGLFLPLIDNAIPSKKQGLKENKLLNTNCIFLHLRSWAPLNICVHLVQFISLFEILRALFIAPKMLKARFIRKLHSLLHLLIYLTLTWEAPLNIAKLPLLPSHRLLLVTLSLGKSGDILWMAVGPPTFTPTVYICLHTSQPQTVCSFLQCFKALLLGRHGSSDQQHHWELARNAESQAFLHTYWIRICFF